MSNHKKKYIPKTLKELVWKTYIGDEFKYLCTICNNKEITPFAFECAHVEPEINGGLTILENLRTVCRLCNSSMYTMNMIDFCMKYFPNANVMKTFKNKEIPLEPPIFFDKSKIKLKANIFKYDCDKCGEKLSGMPSLLRHRSESCPFTKRINTTEIVSHNQNINSNLNTIITRGRHKCPICNSPFSTNSNMHKHIRNTHQNTQNDELTKFKIKLKNNIQDSNINTNYIANNTGHVINNPIDSVGTVVNNITNIFINDKQYHQYFH
jgi:hypothetical protein